MEPFVFIGGAIVAFVYMCWRDSGVRPRSFDTTLDPVLLRQLFVVHVAAFGWRGGRRR